MGKALLIGISALCGGLLFIWIFAIQYPVKLSDWVGLSLFALSCFSGGAVAWMLCSRPQISISEASNIDYEGLGLLESKTYSIKRVFEAEEWEDEGSHYIMELSNDQVLYLSGQYLYDYQEITDDPEFNQEASFPCAEFEIKRHRSEGWTHSIICMSPYTKPEALVPVITHKNWPFDDFPVDGEIYDISYDEIYRILRAPLTSQTRQPD